MAAWSLLVDAPKAWTMTSLAAVGVFERKMLQKILRSFTFWKCEIVPVLKEGVTVHIRNDMNGNEHGIRAGADTQKLTVGTMGVEVALDDIR